MDKKERYGAKIDYLRFENGGLVVTGKKRGREEIKKERDNGDYRKR